MHIHILGICGTFMGGLAILAKSAGYKVTGCDNNFYPPISDQLKIAGIEVFHGWSKDQISLKPSHYIVGNIVSRGNELIETILDKNLPYTSGPQWLAENILNTKWAVAVSGTHGKTTVSSMIAWIAEYADYNPGFLIGGVPKNFNISARLTNSNFFIVEADEYDTSFFDKRSKFVHYKPNTVVLNNLEFDHADIFSDLSDIERQFHFFLRTVPRNGLLVVNGKDKNLSRVLKMGCWTSLQFFNKVEGGWTFKECENSSLDILFDKKKLGTTKISQRGFHHYSNITAAIAATKHLGIPVEVSLEALKSFQGVKLRMDPVGEVAGIKVIRDFAHHPTAIKSTLKALRDDSNNRRVLAVFEPRSNTMKMGVMVNLLKLSLESADKIFCYAKDLAWDPRDSMKNLGEKLYVSADLDDMLKKIKKQARSGDVVVIMSNGDFGGIAKRILSELCRR